jgi:hypothetical protein
MGSIPQPCSVKAFHPKIAKLKFLTWGFSCFFFPSPTFAVPEDKLRLAVAVLSRHFQLRYPSQLFDPPVSPLRSPDIVEQAAYSLSGNSARADGTSDADGDGVNKDAERQRTSTDGLFNGSFSRKRAVRQLADGLYVTFLKEDPFSFARILISLVLFPNT